MLAVVCNALLARVLFFRRAAAVVLHRKHLDYHPLKQQATRSLGNMPLTAASKRRSIKVALLGLVGLTIATYALSVETQMHEPGYEAACDIGAGFSCTAVFSSEFAHPLSH